MDALLGTGFVLGLIAMGRLFFLGYTKGREVSKKERWMGFAGVMTAIICLILLTVL